MPPTPKKPTRKLAAFRLDAPTHKALDYMAQKDRRSKARIVELAVEEYFLAHFGPALEQHINDKANNPSK